MRKLLIFIGFLSTFGLYAQSGSWIFLSDKAGVKFDPYAYFDALAIERRIKNNVPLMDESDFPLRSDYVQSITALAEEKVFESRWFNAVYVRASDAQLEAISDLPFVTHVVRGRGQAVLAGATGGKSQFDVLKEQQINLLGGQLFAQKGLNGKGIRIAVFDGGFPEVDTHPVLTHLREKNLIVGTFNFAKPKKDVYRSNSHGLSTLSNIGGIHENQPLGLAPAAEYLLAITEVNTEIYKEEVWWMAAAEWADKNGAHIISSSLGYTYNRYFPEDMNGQKALVTKAANMAAAKGILVVNSAGNEGDDGDWTVMGAPADADSVLSIGAIDPLIERKIGFSSFGPTADGRMKPNVSASGHTIAAKKKSKVGSVYGTSFSAPLVSGFAACVMQLYPDYTWKQIFDLIEQSGHLYPYFDYAHGYGMPQANVILNQTAPAVPTFELLKTAGSVTLRVTPDFVGNVRTNRTTGTEYLYYHLANANGLLMDYSVVRVYNEEPLTIDIEDFQKEVKTIRIHYRGYSETIQLEDR
jgi:subtilisin family serine protease